MLGAGTHLDLVHDAGIGEGEALAQRFLRERLPASELDLRVWAFHDLHRDVDVVSRGVPGGLARGDARLEVARLVELVLDGAHPVPQRPLAKPVALVEIQGFEQGLGLGVHESGDFHVPHASLLAGRDHERDGPAVGGGIVTDLERDGRAEIALALEAGEHLAPCARQAFGVGRPAQRERGGGGQVRRGQAEVTAPVQLLQEWTPRHPIPKTDPAGLLDLLDLYAVEDSQRPEAVQARAHAIAGQRLPDEVREELLRPRAGQQVRGRHLDTRDRG